MSDLQQDKQGKKFYACNCCGRPLYDYMAMYAIAGHVGYFCKPCYEITKESNAREAIAKHRQESHSKEIDRAKLVSAKPRKEEPVNLSHLTREQIKDFIQKWLRHIAGQPMSQPRYHKRLRALPPPAEGDGK